jgi:hypothetical protein
VIIGATLPDSQGVVLVECNISRHNGKTFLKGLRDQEPVERIPMMERKMSDAHDVTEFNRQQRDSRGWQLLGKELREGPVKENSLKAYLDGHLPATG